MKKEKTKKKGMSEFRKYKILSNFKFVLSIIAGIGVFFGAYNVILDQTSTDNLLSDFDATSSLEKMETPFGIYEGEVSHGVMEGKGNMLFYTGEIYEGQWDDDKDQQDKDKAQQDKNKDQQQNGNKGQYDKNKKQQEQEQDKTKQGALRYLQNFDNFEKDFQ